AGHVVARLVDRAVDHVARLVDAVVQFAEVGLQQDVAVDVDLDQRRGRDLLVHHPVRVDEEGALLINAYGMMNEEITASSLIKIDIDGNILLKPDFGELNYGINKAGYVIHGAIHKARHDVAC